DALRAERPLRGAGLERQRAHPADDRASCVSTLAALANRPRHYRPHRDLVLDGWRVPAGFVAARGGDVYPAGPGQLHRPARVLFALADVSSRHVPAGRI